MMRYSIDVPLYQRNIGRSLRCRLALAAAGQRPRRASAGPGTGRRRRTRPRCPDRRNARLPTSVCPRRRRRQQSAPRQPRRFDPFVRARPRRRRRRARLTLRQRPRSPATLWRQQLLSRWHTARSYRRLQRHSQQRPVRDRIPTAPTTSQGLPRIALSLASRRPTRRPRRPQLVAVRPRLHTRFRRSIGPQSRRAATR